MILNELIQELVNIRAQMGGSLPVMAEITTKHTVYRTDEDGEGYEQTTTEKGVLEVDSVSHEMFPPTRGDAKRKVVLR